MDRSRSEQLKEVISLSRQMLEGARGTDWARVAELECRRRQLVMDCFQQPASVEEAPEVATCIRQILRLNDAITELGRDCRTELGAQLRSRKVGLAASAAYRNCAR